MLTCAGEWVMYKEGFNAWLNYGASINYDINGWGWELSYVDNNCPFPEPNITTARRLISDIIEGTKYEPVIYDDLTIESNLCDNDENQTIIEECAAAIEDVETCCNIIGGNICNAYQAHCEFDTCILVGSGFSVNYTEYIFQAFVETIEFICNIPGVETQEDADRLIEYPGAPTWKPTISPTISPAVSSPTAAPTETANNVYYVCYISSFIISFMALLLA